MMKTTMRLLTALVVTGLLSTAALAESGGWGQDRNQRRNNHERKEKRGHGGKMGGERFCDDIDASPEQRKQLKGILDTHRQAMKNWRQENGKKLRNAHKSLKEARESGDEKAIDAAKLELRKIRESRVELQENFKNQLSKVLAEEQMQKTKKMRKQHRRHGEHFRKGERPYGKLNLTDEQKAQVKKLREEAVEAARSAKTRKEKHEIFKNLRQTINKDVLTKEQREKAADHFKERRKVYRDKFFKEIGATNEQKTSIDKIMGPARKKAEGKDPEERRKIMRDARKEVHENILTDEQREKVKKMKRQRNRGGKTQREGKRSGRGEPPHPTKSEDDSDDG